jgi:carboxylate-amine ligase
VELALSATSPWFAGELTGMASNRAPVLAELPRAGAPPAFASYSEWEVWVERYVRLGVMEDYTRIWWDVRPHPSLGTLEVRVPDQPTDVRLSSAFAALLQALCAVALDGGLDGSSPRVDYVQNRWSAARFGPRAKLIHPDGRSYVPAAELGAELLERVRPAAERLAAADVLARIDPERCEADLQAAAVNAEKATAALVARSLA